jgi:hypothetical protein
MWNFRTPKQIVGKAEEPEAGGSSFGKATNKKLTIQADGS